MPWACAISHITAGSTELPRWTWSSASFVCGPRNSANLRSTISLRLYRGRRLRRDRVDDAHDSLDLVCDPARDPLHYVVGEPVPVRGHRVDGLDHLDRYLVPHPTRVAEDSSDLVVPEEGESLPSLVVEVLLLHDLL